MKKLILFALITLLPMVASAREYELYCSVNDKSTGGRFFEDSSVRFEFEYWRFSPYFIKVKVINKTNGRITIEWENTRLTGEQICFGNDNVYSYNNPKPDEVVHANSYSKKEIGARKDPEMRSVLYSDREIEKNGKDMNSIIIPIKFSSGKIIDYKIYLYMKRK